MTPTWNRLLLRCLQQHCRWPTAGRFIANFAGFVGFVTVWPVWLGYNGAYGSIIMDTEMCHMLEVTVWCNIYFCHPEFSNATEIENDFYKIEMSQKSITHDLPIQLGFHILQLAKLRMLQFYYNCIDKYFDQSDFEYIESDTDCTYMVLSRQSLWEIMKPEFKDEFDCRYLGNCNDNVSFEVDSETNFPGDCCDAHRTFDSRAPGLFKLEASRKAMIALSSKSYIPDKGESQELTKGGCFKLSCKGVNKSQLADPHSRF